MLRRTPRSVTPRQRIAILALTHVVTLLWLLVWSVGQTPPGGPTSASAAAPRQAPVVTVGSGYAVRPNNWQPPVVLTFATPPPPPPPR
jgi:hypothetical protein